MNNTVICDDCQKPIEIKLKFKKVKGDIRQHYFVCLHCNRNYISFYTNPEIRKLQKEISTMRKDPNVDIDKLKHKINRTQLLLLKLKDSIEK